MAEQGNEETKPAPYPHTDQDEVVAVNLLEYIFGWKVRSHIEKRDTVPNHDGTVVIVDSEERPVGQIAVQVKKLPEDMHDPPRKQFETRHLAVCKSFVQPFVVIVVDIDEEVAYWKHVTREYFEAEGLESQTYKTVRFGEDNIIDPENEEYILDWEEIIRDHIDRFEGNVSREQYERLKRHGNPAIGTQQREYRRIHKFLDQLHQLLDGKFSVLMEEKYPDVWRFGFGSIEYEEESLSYTLYPIGKEENDAQIRDVESSWDEIHKLGTSQRHGVPKDNPIERKPEEYAYNVIRKEVEEQIRDRKLDYSDSPFLCAEYVYPFAHKYAPLLGLERKESYSVEEVRNGYYRYLQFWISHEIRYILREHDVGEVGIAIDGYLEKNTGSRYQAAHEAAQERAENTSSDPPRHRIHGSGFEQETLERMIDALVESSAEKIEQPYEDRDRDPEDLDSTDTLWDYYTDESILENAETYYTQLAKSYRQLSQSNFPGIASDLDGNKTNLLLVVVDLESIRAKGWGLTQYWLDGDNEGLRVNFHRISDSEVPEEPENVSEDGIVYNNQTYPVPYSSRGAATGLADTRRDGTPVLDQVHENLRRDISKYLHEKEAYIQHPARD